MEDRNLKRYEIYVTTVTRSMHCVEVESPSPERAKVAAKNFVEETLHGSIGYIGNDDDPDTNVFKFWEGIGLDEKEVIVGEPERVKEVVSGK